MYQRHRLLLLTPGGGMVEASAHFISVAQHPLVLRSLGQIVSPCPKPALAKIEGHLIWNWCCGLNEKAQL
jgi:hypothetical protein